MPDSILPVRFRRCLCVLLPALALAALPLPAQTPEAGESPAAVSVAAVQGDGADLVVYLNWQEGQEVPRRAVLVVLDGGGEPVHKAGLLVPRPGIAPVRLPGFLRLIPLQGPSYQLQVQDSAGRLLAPAEALRVRLACAEPRVCRFRFDIGISAPGALVIDRELADLLDALPVQKQDVAAWTAERAPELLGDARTLVWQLDRLEKAAPGSCQCLWVVARKRPAGRCGNGAEIGLEGVFVRSAAGSLSFSHEAGLSLQQRCWRSAPGGAEEVAVLSGAERLSLKLSRPILAPCAAPCTPTVRYEAALASRAFAEVKTADPGTEASARWSATLLSGGNVLFTADDQQHAAGPTQRNDRTQTDFWSDTAGGLNELILRSETAAEVTVPVEARYVLAVAGVTWRLEARGRSACMKPEGVSAVDAGRPLFVVLPGFPNPMLAHGWDPEGGQIRILSSSECPPGPNG